MVKLSILSITLFLSIAAGAQSPPTKAERDAYREKQTRLIHRAHELRPQRRDTPLRELNISDNEVREIQAVAAKHIPKLLLNISPVVTGCPCEEGPQCSEQVYIVAEKGQTPVGLQLSRVRNTWQIAVVQDWWLDFDALKANRTKMTYDVYAARVDEHFRLFPMCVGNLVPAESTTAAVPKVESGQ